MDFVYKFPVVKGLQAKKEYYIAMVPLGMIEKMFPDEEVADRRASCRERV